MVQSAEHLAPDRRVFFRGWPNKTPSCILMALGAFKICRRCNVLQVPIQIIHLGTPADQNSDCILRILLRDDCRPCNVVSWLLCQRSRVRIPGKIWMSNSVRPRPHQWQRSKNGRREVPSSFPGHASQPSCSELSMVFFSETRSRIP